MYNNCKMDVQKEKFTNNTCVSNRRRVLSDNDESEKKSICGELED